MEHLPAEIQPQARGPLVLPAIASGKALFKNPGQILRRNADSRILNDQRLSRLLPDGNLPLRGVLQGIGENLLHHKAQPLFIGEDLTGEGLHFQLNFLADKQGRIFAHSLTDNPLQGVLLNNKIIGGAPQSEIGQHHFHILLHPEQLRQGVPAPLGFLALQQQTQGGNGRFDLMGPKGVVFQHGPFFLVRGGLHPLLFAEHRPEGVIVIRLNKVPGLGQLLQGIADIGPEGFQLFVAAVKEPEINHSGNQPHHSPQQEHIPQGLPLQMIHGEKKPVDGRQHQQQAQELAPLPAVFPQNFPKRNGFYHGTRYPMPFLVIMKPLRPTPSSFRRRRVTLTVRVFSST